MDSSGGKITWILDADSSQFNSAMKSADAEAAATGASVNKSLGTVNNGLSNAERSASNFGNTIAGTSKSSQKEFGNIANSATANFSSLTGAVDDSGHVIKDVQTAASGAVGQITLLGDAANGSGDAFINAADGAESSSNRIGRAFQSAGIRILAYTSIFAAVAGTTKIIESSVKSFADFDSELGILQQVTGATQAQMKQLSATAVNLGNDISLPGISASDAAVAELELAKAGLSVNDTLAASRGVLSLATAGQLSVADAAQTTAEALNAFGLSGDNANKVADLLAAAANASTASVGDMALGLEQVGSGAKSMGVSLQDTVTALSLFSNAGISGSDAGTSLKQMFVQLASPTKDATALMKTLGLQFYDAQGNFVGLRSAADQLQKTLGPLNTEQKNYALTTIFGSDASRVAGVLARSGAAGFDQMSTSVNKAGAAADLAAAANHGIKGSLSALESNLQTTALAFGKFISGGLKPIIDLANKDLPAAMAVAAAAMIGFSLVIINMASDATLGAIAMDALAFAMDAIPIVALIVGIALLVGGLVALIEHFHVLQKIGAVVGPIFNDIAVVVRLLFDAFTGGDPTLKASEGRFASIARVLSGVGDIMRALYDFVGKQFTFIFASLATIFTDLHAAFKPFIDALVDFYKQHAPIINNVLKIMAVALLALPFAAIASVIGVFVIGLHILAVALGFVADHITQIVHVANDMIQILLGIATVALYPLNKILNAFGTDWGKIWDGIKGAVKDAYDFVVRLLKDLENPIVHLKRLFDDFPTIISNAFKDVTATITAPFKAAFDAVAGFIEDHKKALINIGIVITTLLLPKIALIAGQFAITAAQAVASAAIASAAWVVNAATASFAWVTQELPKIIASFVTTGLAAIKNAVITAGAWLAAAAQTAIEWGITFAILVAGFIATGVEALIAGAQVALAWLLALGPIGLVIAAVIGIVALIIANWSAVKKFLAPIFKWLGDAGVAAWDAIKGAFSAVVGFFVGIFTAVVDFFKKWGITILAIIFLPFSIVLGLIFEFHNQIIGFFVAIVDFFKKWGLDILALMTLPFSLMIIIIVKFHDQIIAFFQAIFDFVVSVFGQIVGFFQTVWAGVVAIFSAAVGFIVAFFQAEWNGIVNIWNAVAGFFQGVWNGIAAVFSAVVGFLVNFFLNEWNGIVNIWNAVAGFFQGVWNGIVSIFSAVGGFFAGVFQGAYNAVVNVFSSLYGFFKGVWNNIVSLFSSVGTSVGNAIGNTFKSVINTVLSGAVGIINGFISAIDAVVGTINHIPGVHVGTLSKLSVPQLSQGGIIQPTATGTLVNVAEAGKPEAVIPLAKLDEMIHQNSIQTAQAVQQQQGDNVSKVENHIGTINIGSEVDAENWLKKLTRQDQVTSSGLTAAQ